MKIDFPRSWFWDNKQSHVWRDLHDWSWLNQGTNFIFSFSEEHTKTPVYLSETTFHDMAGWNLGERLDSQHSDCGYGTTWSRVRSFSIAVVETRERWRLQGTDRAIWMKGEDRPHQDWPNPSYILVVVVSTTPCQRLFSSSDEDTHSNQWPSMPRSPHQILLKVQFRNSPDESQRMSWQQR